MTVIPPAENEIGWKETVPMYPGTVTRVIMKFDISQAKIVDKNLKPVTSNGPSAVIRPVAYHQWTAAR